MGWFVSEERVPVEGLACRCPGQPHESDTVWLRAELGPAGGFAARRAIRAAQGTDFLEENLYRAFCEHGIVDWTFVDEEGEPVPCTPENIKVLSWPVVYPVGERGDVLYAEELTAPLVDAQAWSSRNGHTAQSTSATRKSGSTRQRRSK